MGLARSHYHQSEKKTLFLLLCFACFGVSLIIHFLFFQKARKWEMAGFSPENYDTIVPRTFKMKRVEIDPKTLVEDTTQEKRTPRKEEPVVLEKEMPKIEEPVLIEGKKSILSKPKESTLAQEKTGEQNPMQGLENLLPKPAMTTVDSLNGEVPKGEKNEMSFGVEEALKKAEPKQQESIDSGMNSSGNEAHGSMQPQFSALDDLLASSGGLGKNTAPILMPTDLLFEYDSDALKPAAAETLSKLGNLIKKNAHSSFRIEGHTDSFGSDEYNNQLSLRRAEAVKKWLLTAMGLDTSRITTVGFGKKRLLVPATGSVEKQQLNRRVEIVISTPK